ncbi:MAG: hypothetical protein SCM11_18040, partial [Bacillota bacterium]|nr:hypothetical protein [Bacillota bacterium]
EIEIHQVREPEHADTAAYRSKVEIEVVKEQIEGDRYGDAMTVYAHIARALTRQEPYSVSLDSARNLTRTLDAIRQSAAAGQVIRVN